MSLLAVEGLAGGYGRLRVFSNLSLTISRGETVGIYGPNGAGKTTLLSTIAGLLPAASGRVLKGAIDITRLPAYRRARSGIALVPEGRQVLASLSVSDNLDLTRACSERGESTDRFGERLEEVFDLFPRLKERRGQVGGSLSGGEQQMLAIARALLIQPEFLILDEPTQGLAPVIVKELAGTLSKLKGQFGMIVVEQNRHFLDMLADRSLAMRAGVLS
jgi:branched-chain amino acid transport system ATP-binding protein